MAQSLDEALTFRLGPLGHLVMRLAKIGFQGGHILAQVPDEGQTRPRRVTISPHNRVILSVNVPM